jgi:hypothetical protein
LDLQLPMQSVPIITKVVSSILTHGKLYSIQYYEIKFVSDFRQVSGFSPGILVFSTNETDHHDITEILLKVALSIITLNYNSVPITVLTCYLKPG